MSGFPQDLLVVSDAIDRALAHALRNEAFAEPHAAPARLLAAMRHGVLNGGKRLRPYLTLKTAQIFDVPQSMAMDAALAIEFIHCYSLIHDDLPAMDNDDLRRGQPTVHKAYDDATAILAGDTLLTEAFGLITASTAIEHVQTKTQLIAELVRGAGASGMAGGQMRDLEGENDNLPQNEIAQMQSMKTGALIVAAVRMGALLGQSSAAQINALTTYATHAGRAFQLADDILDVTGTTKQLGKAANKDAERQKPTLISQIGIDAAKRHLGDTIHHALSALMIFGPEADALRETARYFGSREA